MTGVFADTYYFLALLGVRDAGHVRALTASSEARDRGRQLVTTGWVLTELGDALSAPADRLAFLRTVSAIRSDSSFVVVAPTSRLFDAGLELFGGRMDKDWSLTDCVSFVVMKDRGIKEALTGDHHFEQAGFKALLK